MINMTMTTCHSEATDRKKRFPQRLKSPGGAWRLTAACAAAVTTAVLALTANATAQPGQSAPQPAPAELTQLVNLQVPAFRKDTFYIQQYGAKPDAVTLNTGAIQKAIDACAGEGGGVVLVSAGQWLTGPLVLKSKVNLRIARGALLQFTGDFDAYPLVTTNYEGLKAARCQAPISATGQHQIAITGKGIIDGAGDSWRMVKRDKLTASQWKKLVASGGVVDKNDRIWYPSKSSLKGAMTKKPGVLTGGKTKADFQSIKDYLRPNLLSLLQCKDILLEGVTFQNSPAWCLHPLLCEKMMIRDIYVKNEWYAQNGDGLDLESCRQVLIEGSTFDVGDDGICMKSGRDEQGRKRNAPTENVLIQYCTVYHAHGGFVIGSEMSGGVKNVAIRHCNFLGTDIGLRFKTTRGRGGVVEKIYISDIQMKDIKGDAIRFDMYYGAQDPVPLAGENRAAPKIIQVPVTAATPQFRDFQIQNITCHGAQHALFFRGLPEMAIQNIQLSNLVMKSRKGIELTEAKNINIENMQLIIDSRRSEADGKEAAVSPAFLLKNTRHIQFKNMKTTVSENGQLKPAIVEISGQKSADIQLADARFKAAGSVKFHFEGGAKTDALVKTP